MIYREIDESENEPYSPEDDEDDTCPTCGAHEYDPDDMKCPECRSCGGVYSPGTEECDWCPDEDMCSGDILTEV
jgi:hypothetical protein